MFQLRQATLADIPTICTLAQVTWDATYPGIISRGQIDYMLERMYSPEALRQQIEEEKHHFTIAEKTGKTAGFMSLSSLKEDISTGRIYKLYISPDFQKQGVGTQLLDHAHRLAHDTGCTRLELYVNRDNPARHFYRKHGFNIIREEDTPYGPYVLNDYVMQCGVKTA